MDQGSKILSDYKIKPPITIINNICVFNYLIDINVTNLHKN